MVRDRSAASVIQSLIDIKRWRQRRPDVAEARPARCPACGCASCPIGGPVRLHGHGSRDRQVVGPTEPEGPPVGVTISARRYQCQECGAVTIVVPAEIRGRRAYSASAIGYALALWALLGLAAPEVRRRVSPATVLGDTAAAGWASLRRWARDLARGQLLPGTFHLAPCDSLRRLAANAAAALAATADPGTRGLPIEHRAFLGAAHAA